MRPHLRRALPLLPVLALVGCLMSPFEELTRVESVAPTALACGGCHVAIYEEFMSSAHARSWSSPPFVEATSDYRFEQCLGCHAPASVFGEGPPTLRETHREEGVTCVSCHFDGDVMLGPARPSALMDPHPVRRTSRTYLSSDLCGSCHVGTMQEWRAAPGESKPTCQACHMPPVTRTLTQGTGLMSNMLVSFEEPYEGRKHLFHIGTEEVFSEGLAGELVDSSRGPDGVRCELLLINRVPHLVPTGDFGVRLLDLGFEALDQQGVVLSRSDQQLRRALGQSLQPDERRALSVRLPSAAWALRLVVSSVAANSEPIVVLTRQWELP